MPFSSLFVLRNVFGQRSAMHKAVLPTPPDAQQHTIFDINEHTHTPQLCGTSCHAIVLELRRPSSTTVSRQSAVEDLSLMAGVVANRGNRNRDTRTSWGNGGRVGEVHHTVRTGTIEDDRTHAVMG